MKEGINIPVVKDRSSGFKITKNHKTAPIHVAVKRAICIWNGVTHFHRRKMYEVTNRQVLPKRERKVLKSHLHSC